MFPSPTLFLEAMLQLEKQQVAWYAVFPHVRVWQPYYDAVSGPLKIIFIGLARLEKGVPERTSAD